VWLSHLVLQITSSCAIPFSKIIFKHYFAWIGGEFKETYVLILLNDYNCVSTNFDLWMSKGAHDVFVLIINFLGSD
jgi:hypothetical protein